MFVWFFWTTASMIALNTHNPKFQIAQSLLLYKLLLHSSLLQISPIYVFRNLVPNLSWSSFSPIDKPGLLYFFKKNHVEFLESNLNFWKQSDISQASSN